MLDRAPLSSLYQVPFNWYWSRSLVLVSLFTPAKRVPMSLGKISAWPLVNVISISGISPLLKSAIFSSIFTVGFSHHEHDVLPIIINASWPIPTPALSADELCASNSMFKLSVTCQSMFKPSDLFSLVVAPRFKFVE